GAVPGLDYAVCIQPGHTHAHRAGVGSAARRRDRLPVAGLESYPDQTVGLYHGRHVRRLWRRLLRCAARPGQSRVLHLHGVGPEFGRALAVYRMLIFGLVMVLMMMWRPQGLLPVKRPQVELKA